MHLPITIQVVQREGPVQLLIQGSLTSDAERHYELFKRYTPVRVLIKYLEHVTSELGGVSLREELLVYPANIIEISYLATPP